ncbi:SprT family zinc-dependent metalloprotease [Paraferrimonas sedimenticola]|uniref:Protein SprT n=1 Tax=Paraferrimonas sedimenticola TaxID=375674 RepID=A0AA37VUC2_9GAMM|nr:SprT family zinc-dependent metalloprotease [Paraferrimonas sedimenticola]GLP95576.1 protein SprT [Paraferrimonas sedimenticola]
MPSSRHLDSQLQQALEQRVETCFQALETALERSFSRPSIEFSQRGKAAGSAYLTSNRLRFHPVLYKDNQQAFLQEVVPHEVCHLVCHQVYGKVRPHGPEWRALMAQVFGLNPKATHSFDVSKVIGKTFEYQCTCGPVSLTLRRHNKVLSGVRYQCRRCGDVLTQISAQIAR